MKPKQKVCMLNTSAPKVFFGILMTGVLYVFVFGEISASSSGSVNAVVSKYEETSKALFEEAPAVQEKLKDDPFFVKMRKKNSRFTKEESEKRRAFIEKIRAKDWTDEKKQQALSDFQKKALARRNKFIDKQQKKIQKHQEEGS